MIKFIFAALVLSQSVVFGANLKEQVAAVNAAYPGACQAWSDCLDPWGYPYKRISCFAYGPNCTWYVDPYRSVACSGYDNYGNYSQYSEYCQQ